MRKPSAVGNRLSARTRTTAVGNLRPTAESRRPRARLGFNLIELLIALAITATLLVAAMVALDASYTAYQRTTRAASTHNVSNITMDRIKSLVRNGESFEPRPADPNVSIIESDWFEILLPADGAGNQRALRIEWDQADEALYVISIDANTGQQLSNDLLLEGVVAQYDGGGNQIMPFTLEYHLGHRLHRATIDLLIVPDDNLDVEIDGQDPYVIRLIGTAMPRRAAYH
jgi:prepilin-type N-terminal cleavage/methylation domain-containing protein